MPEDRRLRMTGRFGSKCSEFCAYNQAVRTASQGRFEYPRVQFSSILQRSCGTPCWIAKCNCFAPQDLRVPHAAGRSAKTLGTRGFRVNAPRSCEQTRKTRIAGGTGQWVHQLRETSSNSANAKIGPRFERKGQYSNPLPK